MNEIETLKKIIELENERAAQDSKKRYEEIVKEFQELNVRQFDGRLVSFKGKVGRIWHAYYGTYYVYGPNKTSFTWTSNYRVATLDEVEWLEEDNSNLERKLSNIDEKIWELEEKIQNLKNKRQKLCADFVVKVNPKSFVETTQRNHGAFSMDGDPVYISEAYCEVTNQRITS